MPADPRREIVADGSRWLVEHYDPRGRLLHRDRCNTYAQALVVKYRGLGHAQAAKVYRWCKGRVDLEALRSAADEALCKAAVRFDPTRLGQDSGQPVSFAPYARRWAYEACMDAALVDWDRPWLESDDERRTEEEVVPLPDLDPRDAERLRMVCTALPPLQREIAALWAAGADDDDVCTRLGMDRSLGLPLQDALRTTLAKSLADLRAPAPAAIGLAEAATRSGRSPSAIRTLIQRGQIPGAFRRGGRWHIPGDWRPLARQRKEQLPLRSTWLIATATPTQRPRRPPRKRLPTEQLTFDFEIPVQRRRAHLALVA